MRLLFKGRNRIHQVHPKISLFQSETYNVQGSPSLLPPANRFLYMAAHYVIFAIDIKASS